MKKIYKVKVTLLIVISLIGLTLLSRAIGLVVNRHKQVPQKISHTIAVTPLVYDTLVVKKFNDLLRSMDFNQENCFYSGNINLTDGKDSANNIHDLKFLYCKQGNAIYYHLGQTETINNGDFNIFIDNDNKKVAVSNQHFEANSPVKSAAFVVSQLRSENYTLQSSAAGGSKKLSVLNERHVTCKEVSLTYDTVSNKLQKVYTRFTDIADISSKAKERRVEIRIDRQDDKAEPNLYPVSGDIVRKENGKWVLRNKYANYELIIL